MQLTLNLDLHTGYFWNDQQFLLNVGKLQFIWGGRGRWGARSSPIEHCRQCSRLEFLLATGYDLHSTVKEMLT